MAAEAAAEAARAARSGGAAGAAKRIRGLLSTSEKVVHTENFVELCVRAELPFHMSHVLPWQEFFEKYGIPLTPETTAHDRFLVICDRDVDSANKAFVGSLVKESKIAAAQDPRRTRQDPPVLWPYEPSAGTSSGRRKRTKCRSSTSSPR